MSFVSLLLPVRYHPCLWEIFPYIRHVREITMCFDVAVKTYSTIYCNKSWFEARLLSAKHNACWVSYNILCVAINSLLFYFQYCDTDPPCFMSYAALMQAAFRSLELFRERFEDMDEEYQPVISAAFQVQKALCLLNKSMNAAFCEPVVY